MHSADPRALEYVPAVQLVHCEADVAEVALENVPAAHAVQVDEFDAPVTLEYVPAVHLVHCEADVAEVAWENVPAAHTVQVDELDAPVTVENFPAAQSSHEESPPSSPNLPCGQTMQEDPDTDWVALPNFPEGHVLQPLLPGSSWYFPCEHEAHHSWRESRYFPAAQFVQLELPTALGSCPRGQGTSHLKYPEPGVVFPVAQSVHVGVALVYPEMYFPAAQVFDGVLSKTLVLVSVTTNVLVASFLSMTPLVVPAVLPQKLQFVKVKWPLYSRIAAPCDSNRKRMSWKCKIRDCASSLTHALFEEVRYRCQERRVRGVSTRIRWRVNQVCKAYGSRLVVVENGVFYRHDHTCARAHVDATTLFNDRSV